MIKRETIRHKGLAELYSKGRSSKVSGRLVKRVKFRMDILDAVTNLNSLSAFQNLDLHQLSGKKEGRWSIKVSGPWRLTFRFEHGDVIDLDLEQYH